MVFKPLEMQIVVPRTQDASVLQSQAAQRPITEQTLLANQSEKETERNRTKSTKTEKTIKSEVHTNGQGASSGQEHSDKRAKTSTDAVDESPVHPYKGHNLDISL